MCLDYTLAMPVMPAGGNGVSTSRSYAQDGGHCTIDIVGVFVRVSCPSECMDGCFCLSLCVCLFSLYSARAALTAKRCEYEHIVYHGVVS